MKKYILLVALVCFTTNFYAQIDRSGGKAKVEGMRIPAKAESSLPLPNNNNLSILRKDGLFAPEEKPLPSTEEKKPLNMRTDNGLMELTYDNFKPKAFKDKDTKESFKSDQYLGDFKTSGDFVEVYCRDHEFVDGDRVRILVNGEIIYNNLYLTGSYSPILVKLKPGFNTIEFHALNQGSSGPNTAELRVFDDKGKELTQNEWNLMTGGKANIIVVKE